MSEIKLSIKRSLFIVTLMVTATSNWQVFAKTPFAGNIILITGKAMALSLDGQLRELERGEPFYAGETITTDKKASITLKYSDGGVMLLRPATKLIIKKYKYTKKLGGHSVIKLVKGGLRTVTGVIAKRDRDNYKLITPAATLTVRGTDFTIRFCNEDCIDLEAYGAPAPDNGLYVGVNKGGIVLKNSAGSQLYKVGQFGYIAGTQFKPILLPAAPAIFVIDNLPDPKKKNSDGFKDNACK
ncbi:MAG: FecR domain-containing protein [Sulfuriflexus sp.]|nr:FecR domain-containing protein [Sulfuriflexus sp.]